MDVTVIGGTAPYSYSWSGPDGFTSTDEDPQISDVTADNAGEYEVEVTDSNGCSVVSASTTVMVNELPSVNVDDLDACEGSDVTVDAVASGGSGNYVNYTWIFTPEGGGSSSTLSETSSSLSINSLSLSDAGTYEVTVEDNNGCISPIDGMTLTVNENPEVSIDGAPEIQSCEGDDLLLDATATGGNGSYSFIWELPDGSTYSGDELPLNNISESDEGTYSVTVSDENSCTVTTSVEVLVSVVQPVLDASASTICVGNEVTFTASGGEEYEFFVNGNSAQGPSPDDTMVTDTLSHGSEVTVRVIDQYGCEAVSDAIEMTVLENPEVDITNESLEVCANSELEVVATSGYENYIFFVNGDTVQNSADSTYVDMFNDGDEIYVQASTGELDCSADSDVEIVTVYSVTNAGIDNVTGPVCGDGNSDILLEGSPDTMNEYQWMFEGDVINNSRDHTITDATVDSAGVYSLIITDGNGCMDTATVDVVVHSIPVVDLGNDIVTCEGNNIELNAAVSNGAEPYDPFEWEFDNSPISGEEDTYIIENADVNDDQGEYAVRVTDVNSCISDWSSIQVTVNPAPTVDFDLAQTSNEVCDGEQVTLTAEASGGVESGDNADDYQYVWYYDGAEIPGVSTGNYSFEGIAGENDGVYEVVAIDDNGEGCGSATASIDVTVHSLPDATLTPDPTFFIEGSTVEFTAGDGTDEYTFFVNGEPKRDLDTDNTFETNELADGDSVSVEVVNTSTGCFNSDYIIMTGFEGVEQPELNVIDSVFYCDDEIGATVEVVNPQQDVTYEIVRANGDPTNISYDVITYDGSNQVMWEGVFEEEDLDSTVLAVKAYWEMLADSTEYSESFKVVDASINISDTVTADSLNVYYDGISVDEDTVTHCNDGEGYEFRLSSWNGNLDYILMVDGIGIDTLSNVDNSNFSFGYKNFAGTYTVKAINDYGCETMMRGRFTVLGSEEVEYFDIIPEDGRYCYGTEGVNIELNGSQEGFRYYLHRNWELIENPDGTGDSLDFGVHGEEGQYTVSTISSDDNCTYIMDDLVVEELEPVNPGEINIQNDGHYCEGGEGVEITLSDQEEGMEYFLLHGTDSNDPDTVAYHEGAAEVDPIEFINNNDSTTLFTREGDYFVIARTLDYGCYSDSSNVVTIEVNPLPEDKPILGYGLEEGEVQLCGGVSTSLFVEDTQDDVLYQLYDIDNDSLSNGQTGYGGPLFFSVHDTSSYTIFATDLITGCDRYFEDTITVTQGILPADTVSVDTMHVDVGDACGERVVIQLIKPEVGVTYSLWKRGENNGLPFSEVSVDSAVDTLVVDSIIDTNNAEYYIEATSHESGCSTELLETVVVDIEGAMEVFDLVADDNICVGDGEVYIETSGSQEGIKYALVNEATESVIDTVSCEAGDNCGEGLLFETPILSNGTYYLQGTDEDGCTVRMATHEIKFNPLPSAFELTGSGVYCDDTGEGAPIGISGSEFDVEYFLVKENEDIVDEGYGKYDGSGFEFDTRVRSGAYTVYARNSKTSCTSSMKDTVRVTLKNSPANPHFGYENDTVYYCDYGAGGFPLELDTSVIEDGVTYSLFDENGELMDERVAEGNILEPWLVIDGSYTVNASWGGEACISEFDTIRVVASEPPAVLDKEFSLSGGSCYGDTMTISYPVEPVDSEDPVNSWSFNLVDENNNAAVFDTVYYDEENGLKKWEVTGVDTTYFIQIQSEGEACPPVYSKRIDIEFGDPVPIGELTSEYFGLCEGEDSTHIVLNGVEGSSILYHLYREQDMDDLDGYISTQYGAFEEVEFRDVERGSYVFRSEDVKTGCFSDPTEIINVEPYLSTEDREQFLGIYWSMLNPEIDTILYMSNGVIDVELDTDTLYDINPEYQYKVTQYNNDEYTYDILEGRASITEASDDYVVAADYSPTCPLFPITPQLTILEDSINAKDVYIYLTEDQNSDTVFVDVEHSPLDEGFLQYSFQNEENIISIPLLGDFNIDSSTGLVKFDRAPSFYGEDRIRYIVKNSENPQRADTAYIWVYGGNNNLTEDKSIFIPNAFSPNGDGYNDYFVISSNNSRTEESTLEIYNRWGTLVYRSDGTNYQNDWDGTGNVSNMVSIGDDLPNGVYFYVYTVRANVEDDETGENKIVNKKFNGFVELRR